MKNYLSARAPAAALLIAASLGLAACNRAGHDRHGELVLSGNFEVEDAQLGFKAAGRVVERTVREGDRVTAGQLVARLDDAEQQAQLALRQAELKAATAALAELEAGSRPQEIAAAAATARSAEADRDRVRLDFARLQELRGKEVISERDFEAGQAQLKVAEARVAEATEKLALVREGPRKETIQQARARVEQARAAVNLASTQVDNTRLHSPLAGTVLSHNIEPGEFVSPGTPVVTVADTARLWVRAYLDQPDLGRVRHGQKLVVRTDSFPGRDFEGVVGFIASESEFTPKTVQTPKERVKLVFRIKVDVANPKDELKPGMPADIVVPAAE
ncbi:MAG TPA: HlyD family efflux transporter periplasmic adaptor subunit [Lacunisphaera sp.]|nr:HlyD family efflux transporter periplasmic adaptor subunit [Lacunisphaera sp.]